MTPFVADPDFTLYVGDAIEVLRELPAGSVDCCVTSPPYWGLRDYGTEGQLGLEATPGEYVDAMVAVFAEVRRVLAHDGTLWLNLGDTFNSNPSWGRGTLTLEGRPQDQIPRLNHTKVATSGLKVKDLVGIPWRVAFALQDAGWYLRSDIIWAKPNPMPESVTDRPTKAHEYVFLLSKQQRYFFDQEAVREPHSPDGRLKTVHDHATPKSHPNYDNVGNGNERWPNGGRNIRSVWEIATQPYPEAHFATFPEELPRRCILAGCPEWVCRVCGTPRERLVERTAMEVRPTAKREAWQATDDHARTQLGGTMLRPAASETVGWSDCGHGDYRPGVVLDPFMGSGTTSLVARKLGRHAVGIELNPAYADLAARRLQQLSLLA